jgi:hypothetical protein
MRTFPHIREDRTIAYFEISNAFPWSWGFMRRVLTSVQGVSDFKRARSNDDRFAWCVNRLATIAAIGLGQSRKSPRLT